VCGVRGPESGARAEGKRYQTRPPHKPPDSIRRSPPTNFDGRRSMPDSRRFIHAVVNPISARLSSPLGAIDTGFSGGARACEGRRTHQIQSPFPTAQQNRVSSGRSPWGGCRESRSSTRPPRSRRLRRSAQATGPRQPVAKTAFSALRSFRHSSDWASGDGRVTSRLRKLAGDERKLQDPHPGPSPRGRG
jgi:hypothetical protein